MLASSKSQIDVTFNKTCLSGVWASRIGPLTHFGFSLFVLVADGELHNECVLHLQCQCQLPRGVCLWPIRDDVCHHHVPRPQRFWSSHETYWNKDSILIWMGAYLWTHTLQRFNSWQCPDVVCWLSWTLPIFSPIACPWSNAGCFLEWSMASAPFWLTGFDWVCWGDHHWASIGTQRQPDRNGFKWFSRSPGLRHDWTMLSSLVCFVARWWKLLPFWSCLCVSR